jgi:hypothetical protein
MKEMTEQEKKDVLALDEVMTFFLIEETAAFIWRITHDMADGKLDQTQQTKDDLQEIVDLQNFAVDNLDRFGVKDKKEDLKKWHAHWSNWRNELPKEHWEKVSVGEYEEFLPEKKWNEEVS